MATQKTTAPRAGAAFSPKPPGRGMNPMFAGIIIGLLLGILLALGVAVWLNRNTSSAFVEKTKPVEALVTLPAKPSAASGAPAGDKPRFEFYELLPGDKNAAKRSPEAAPPAPSESSPHLAQPNDRPTKAATALAPARDLAPGLPPAPAQSTPPAPLPATLDVYFLQAGAFQNATDADNLKAKIAFAGFEASVKPVNVPDKGTLFRVRLGPYKGIDEVNRIKATLSQNGIAASAVRSQ